MRQDVEISSCQESALVDELAANLMLLAPRILCSTNIGHKLGVTTICRPAAQQTGR